MACLLDNVQRANYSFARRFVQGSSLVSIKCIIGCDLVWYLDLKGLPIQGYRQSKVNYFSLLMIISDIQRAVNNSLLTYHESASRELEAITPNNFIRPNKNPGLLLCIGGGDLSSVIPPSQRRLIKSMEMCNNFLDRFQCT